MMGAEKTKMKVMIIDDNELYLRTLKLLMSRAGYEVVTANSVDSGFDTTLRERPELVISDYNLADGTGLELLEKLRPLPHSLIEQPHYIIMSGRPAEVWQPLCQESPVNTQVVGFLQKPFTFAELQKLLTGLAQTAVPVS